MFKVEKKIIDVGEKRDQSTYVLFFIDTTFFFCGPYLWGQKLCLAEMDI